MLNQVISCDLQVLDQQLCSWLLQLQVTAAVGVTMTCAEKLSSSMYTMRCELNHVAARYTRRAAEGLYAPQQYAR